MLLPSSFYFPTTFQKLVVHTYNFNDVISNQYLVTSFSTAVSYRTFELLIIIYLSDTFLVKQIQHVQELFWKTQKGHIHEPILEELTDYWKDTETGKVKRNI